MFPDETKPWSWFAYLSLSLPLFIPEKQKMACNQKITQISKEWINVDRLFLKTTTSVWPLLIKSAEYWSLMVCIEVTWKVKSRKWSIFGLWIVRTLTWLCNVTSIKQELILLHHRKGKKYITFISRNSFLLFGLIIITIFLQFLRVHNPLDHKANHQFLTNTTSFKIWWYNPVRILLC